MSTHGFSCELDDKELSAQVTRWREMRPFIVAHVRFEGGLALTFDPSCHERLVSLVATEQRCCGWAAWSLTRETAGSVLEVRGPSAELAALAGAFAL